MKILFIAGMDVTIHPNHRAHHFIAFLERFGIQVDVISMTPFYTGRESATPWTRFQSGLCESIVNPVVIQKRKTGIEVDIRRLPGRLDAFLQSFWAYLHLCPLFGKRYDVCIFGNPDNVLLTLLLKKRGVVGSIIYDDWDFYPGFNRSWLWNRLTIYREQVCVSLADVVISVGSLLADLRKRQGAVRTLVIPNGVNYPLFAAAQTKGPHVPTLIYSGKLADDFGVDVSIKGFARVVERIPEARYLIISYDQGPYAQYLRTLVDQLGISKNVVFPGPKRYEELPQYMAEADIGVALFKQNDLMKYAFPLKVVEYMAAGLAVIGTEIGETEKLICEGKCGRCVPYSPEAFASAVLDILSDDTILKNYRENASEYARGYDWDLLFTSLLDVIEAAAKAQDRGTNL